MFIFPARVNKMSEEESGGEEECTHSAVGDHS